MKLLYIHQYFKFPTVSGGTRSYDLAKKFIEDGIDVTIITSSSVSENTDRRWTYTEIEGIKLWTLKNACNNEMSFKQRIYSFAHFLFFSSIKSLQIKCDVLLVTSTPLTVAVPALVKHFFSRTKFVFEVRDVWPEVPIKMGIIKNKFVAWILRKFEILIYKKASYIVPLSIGMKENIMQRYHSCDKFMVIPNLSSIERFSNIQEVEIKGLKSIVKDKKVIIYCGTVGLVNGLQFLVDLAEKTRKRDDIVYLIFGKGNDLKSVLKKSIETKVKDYNLFFMDEVKKNDLPYLYSLSTMGSSFVIDNPILWDNSANKFFDTLAAGRPILINHEGWQAKVIRDNNCGYVLPPILTNDEIFRFLTYLDNEELLRIQGNNAYELACKEYSINVAAQKYLTIFKSIS